MLPDVSMLIDFARMVIEIAILTLVIYKILYYMRGARGSYVLAGIISIPFIVRFLNKTPTE